MLLDSMEQKHVAELAGPKSWKEHNGYDRIWMENGTMLTCTCGKTEGLLGGKERIELNEEGTNKYRRQPLYESVKEKSRREEKE